MPNMDDFYAFKSTSGENGGGFRLFEPYCCFNSINYCRNILYRETVRLRSKK